MSFDFNYYGDLEHVDGLLPMFAIFGSVILVAIILGSLFGFAVHVIRALAIYHIGKRRGLKNPWLAWIPVGQEWIIGSLSDQEEHEEFAVLDRAGRVQIPRELLDSIGVGGNKIRLKQEDGRVYIESADTHLEQ